MHLFILSIMFLFVIFIFLFDNFSIIKKDNEDKSLSRFYECHKCIENRFNVIYFNTQVEFREEENLSQEHYITRA